MLSNENPALMGPRRLTLTAYLGGRSARLVREERVLLIAAEIGAPLGIAHVQGVELDRGESLLRGDYPDRGVPS